MIPFDNVKIIAQLEDGIVTWVQPWTSSRQLCPLGLPVNGLTRRSYSGINILLLWSALEDHGFASPYWVTFKQCIAMGGTVRKGEKGTHVYFADKFVPQKEKARAEEAGDEPNAIAFLKRYTVFNAEQCDGLPKGLIAAPAPKPERQIVPDAEALIAATGADCHFDRHVFVDGRLVATAKISDRNHRLLPVWRGCRTLESDEIFVLAKPSHSFGSRYFGPINRRYVVGAAIPLRIP